MEEVAGSNPVGPSDEVYGHKWFWFIVILAALLRLTNLTHTSLWQDEIYSLMVATLHNTIPASLDLQPHTAQWWVEQSLTWQAMDFLKLIEILKDNVHMPLYYVLLNPWLNIFGVDAFGLRLFSVVPSVLMLWPLYELGKSMFNERVGLFAVFIAAVSPFQLYFAQEGRMYSLVMLWAVLSTLCFWKILFSEKPLKWSPGYAASVVLGVLTHYMFVFLLVFHAYMVFVTLTWPYQKADNIRPKRLLWLVAGPAAVLLVAIAWFPVYLAQKAGVDSGYHFAKGGISLLQGLSAPFWQAFVSLAGDVEGVRVFYGLFLLLLGLYMWFKSKPNYTGFLYKLTLLGCGITIPMWSMFLYDIYNQSHTALIDRYGTLIAPMVYLLTALLLANFIESQQKKKGVVLGLLIIISLMAVWAPSPLRDEHNKKNIRAKMQYMVNRAGKNDLILATGVSGAPVLGSYYLNSLKPDQPVLYWVNELRGQQYDLPGEDYLRQYDTIWVLKLRATEERGGEELDTYMRGKFPGYVHKGHWDIYTVR